MHAPTSSTCIAPFLKNGLRLLDQLRAGFDAVAEERSKHLVEAHERFSRFFRVGRFEVVYPVLPIDVLGLYILLPAAANA